MATERLRIFKGATELSYSDCKINKTNDHVVDSANLSIESESVVVEGSVIDFKKADGSTTIFSAKVINKKEVDMWDLQCLTNGYELINLRIDKVYINTAPEDIVKDIVDNFTTNLTFASTVSSGVIWEEYDAKEYAIDIIKNLADSLQWKLRIDSNDNLYFEPAGNINNGVVLTNGSNFNITKWEGDDRQLFNRVKVIGGFESHNTTEVISGGPQKTFVLSNKPSGSFVARDAAGGNEISPVDYKVNAETPNIVFDNNQTNPEFTYSFDEPIIVDNQDDESISNQAQEIYQEVQAPWLDGFADARRYSQNLLDSNSTTQTKVEGFEAGLQFVREVNEEVMVIDPTRSDRQADLVITRLVFDTAANITSYELGPRNVDFADLQGETENRIKKIERRNVNATFSSKARVFKHNLKITLTLTETFEQNSPTNSFIFGHPTLGYFRRRTGGSARNRSADNSNNGNYGTWTGSNVGGSQFTTSGNRLSAGDWNGTDTLLTIADASSIQNVFDGGGSILVAISPDGDGENDEGRMVDKGVWSLSVVNDNASGVQLQLDYSFSGTNGQWITNERVTLTTFADISLTYDNSSTSNVPVITIDGVTSTFGTVTQPTGTRTTDVGTNLFVGNNSGATRTFDGLIDELMLFDATVTAGNITTYIALDYYNSSNAYQFIADPKCHLSMDDPQFGIRNTVRTTI